MTGIYMFVISITIRPQTPSAQPSQRQIPSSQQPDKPEKNFTDARECLQSNAIRQNPKSNPVNRRHSPRGVASRDGENQRRRKTTASANEADFFTIDSRTNTDERHHWG
jgi:hypothetical protein